MHHHLPTSLLLLGLTLLTLSHATAQAPANDECAGATVISSPLPYSASQNTRLATPNITDPLLLCADSGGGKTVWYTWTADSSGYVTFTTAGSTPTDYDVALGLYTGSCGALVEIDCNDDILPGSVRQSVITHAVTMGTTYILQVAEWNGGGPSGGVPTGGDLVFDVYWDSLQPLYAGPKIGLVPSGATISTTGFGNVPMARSVTEEEAEKEMIREAAINKDQILLPTPDDVMKPLGPAGSNFKDARLDRSADAILTPPSKPVIVKNFQGNTATGAIPPDPILAVGPNHVIGAVNSSFRIWDKSGNLLKDIPMSTWFSNVKSPVGFSDPQLLYDHYAGRWIVAGGGFDEPYAILISVSDDDDPLGTWTNWSLPADIGDSVTGNLPDYPQMGYDENAIYVTTREFNPGFSCTRLRIIDKAQLYDASPDSVVWRDFWGFRDPDHRTVTLDGIRPSIVYGAPGLHFMVNASPYSIGTFFTVWRIYDPLGATTIDAANVPVVEYTTAPNPSQLGGGTPIEGGGSVIRHKAVYRDSSLWMVHSIAIPPANAYSAVRYVRINPFTMTNLEDVASGTSGYWHFYATLMADALHNVIMTFTRSGDTEYAGAFVAGHRDIDPPGLSESIALKSGLGNYDLVGGGRNRWGDYNGAGLDPADSTAIWVNSEFAMASNNWQTWIGKVKMAPVQGAFLFANPQALNFGPGEVGLSGDTASIVMQNLGVDTLVVDSISIADSNFALLSPPSLPRSLASFETDSFRVAFTPKLVGSLVGSVALANSDTANPVQSVDLVGNGFHIIPVTPGTIYATTGSPGLDSAVLTVDGMTGTATTLGKAVYDKIISAKVNPVTRELIGLQTTGSANMLVRINAEAGDAHPMAVLPTLAFLKGMGFKDDTLYIGRVNGAIYRVNIATGAATLIASTGISIAGLDINPLTGDLWISDCQFGGCATNKIYKMKLPSGPVTLVGATGLGGTQPTFDLMFDGAGTLYGLIGNGYGTNSLALIDTATGAATIIGSLGRASVQSLAMLPDSLVASLAFGYLGVDSTRTDTVTVTNPGGGTLDILSAVTDNPMYSVTPGSASIPPSGSQEFLVTFHPTSAGHQRGKVIFAYDTTGPRGVVTLSGTGAVPASSEIHVMGRWNLSSLPLLVSDYRASVLFPTATSPAFEYNGSYVARETLANGRGFWIRFGSTGTLPLDGFGGGSDTLPVVAGWNIIGSVQNPAPVAAMAAIGTAVTSSIYGYDGAYFVEDTIRPGNGYWAKATSAGKLVLNNPEAVAKPLSDFGGYNLLTITDAAGNMQRLYVGSAAADEAALARAEMPPVPPADAFDARFASNRLLELHAAKPTSAAEFPLKIQVAQGGVTVGWKIESGAGVRYTLVARDENGLNRWSQTLNGEGSRPVAASDVVDLRLRAEERLIPAEYALRQNYPNPFNPTTTIRYELPQNGHVRLAVYDMLGKVVSTLADGDQEAGYYEVSFGAEGLASGVYFYRLTAGTYSSIQKMLLVR